MDPVEYYDIFLTIRNSLIRWFEKFSKNPMKGAGSESSNRSSSTCKND